MNEKRLKQIQKFLRMGKWNYVLKRGVLFWGVSMAVLMNIFYLIMGVGFSLGFILVTTVIFLIGGLIFGLWTWYLFNKKLKSN